MKSYQAENIRNIAVAGHGGSGKTSFVEAVLYQTKMTDRMGKIAEGNTVCDYDPEEAKRLASLSLAVAPVELKNTKINLIDTPGLFDFAAGMHEGIWASDTVLLVVSGKSGVAVGTKKAYDLAVKMKKARAIFVNKLDRESADFYKVLEGLKSAFGPSVCPIVVPIFQNQRTEGYVDLIDMKAYKYDGKGGKSEIPVPDMEHRLDGLVAAISEAVAETDEALFEKYFSGEKFTHDELVNGIRSGVKQGDITPVFCGSAIELDGIDLAVDYMESLIPPAAQSTEKTEDGREVAPDVIGTPAAYVFKTIADPFVGKMSFFKVLSGKISADTILTNNTAGEQERIGKLMFVRGKKQEDTKEVCAGDIGVATKLSANTGDTLSADKSMKFPAIEFPKSCYSLAVKAKAKGDESKISQGIHRLLEEDRTLSFEINTETKQQILSGLGEQHIEVAVTKLKSKYGVDVELETPIIPYRETIRKKVKVEGKHKKQTGGHGQFGHVWIEFEPCDSDDLVFEEKIFGGAVPKGFFPAVEKGLRESAMKGVLAGYPVVGLKATLVDGSYHPVDSSEMSFKMAAGIAYRAGVAQASPILLEPIGLLKVTVPDANTGDMMGDLNKRRGRVLGMNPADIDGMTVIEAEVPMSEMQDFATLVRQMAQGAGEFTLTFERYEPLPAQFEADVIEKAKALAAEE